MSPVDSPGELVGCWYSMSGDVEGLRGSGALAGVVAGLAAELLSEVARGSREGWEDAGGAAAQGRALSLRAAWLADRNVVAFGEALRELREPGDVNAVLRDARLGDALYRAGETAALIADLAADVAELAAVVGAHGQADRRADAVAGAFLALGCARAAAHLVQVNLGAGGDDGRVLAARAAVVRAVAAAELASQLDV